MLELEVCPRTVRNRLHSVNIHHRIPAKKGKLNIKMQDWHLQENMLIKPMITGHEGYSAMKRPLLHRLMEDYTVGAQITADKSNSI